VFLKMKVTKMYLVAIKGINTRVVKEGVVKILQAEKKKLAASGNWKGYIFQIRNIDAYKNHKILLDKDGGVRK
jgi:hypothetical protein